MVMPNQLEVYLLLVIHLIDFSNRNQWLEKQFPLFLEAGIDQALVSISPEGDIHAAVRAAGFFKVRGINRNISGFLSMILTLRKWNQESDVYIYSHGHLPSIYASFLTLFLKIEFVICHHQPNPDYFFEFRKRNYARATVHEILARFYYVRAKRIQALSSEVQVSLMKREISCQKIVRIPLGLDFSNFQETKSHYTKLQDCKVIKIVSVGRLVWEKRIDLGIETMANLQELGINVKYSIVGEGPELFRLQKLVGALGLEERVEFCGQVDEINSILNESDMLFHLSISESYGQVIMESRLINLPIFTSPCGVALDMESFQDNLVRVYRTNKSLEIAFNLIEFVKNVSNIDTFRFRRDGKELYFPHSYEVAIQQVVKMFKDMSVH